MGRTLWRLSRRGVWQHLAAVPQALIAAAVGGPYVYTLGYFNHVLFQFDTRSGRMTSVTVGSVGGHVSRNFFADRRGHAYVPRVRRNGDRPEASLVELDADLHEVGETPLGEYFERSPDESHGVVATQPDGADGWYFTTGRGRLYHVQPQPSWLVTGEPTEGGSTRPESGTWPRCFAIRPRVRSTGSRAPRAGAARHSNGSRTIRMAP